MAREINDLGLQLIKEFESFRASPYLDSASIATIGWGSTYYEDGSHVKMSDEPIDEYRANQLLKNKLNLEFCPGVEQLVKVKITDNMFAALVCFAYNVGLHNLEQSTALKCCNSLNWSDAAHSLLLWNKSGGIVLPGLTRRREAEKALFLAP